MRRTIHGPLVAMLILLASLLGAPPSASHAASTMPVASTASAIAAAAIGYDTTLNVAVITGSLPAQRAIGQAIRDAETQNVGFILSGDSRFTAMGGAGTHMIDALVLGLPTLTTHGNIPQTPALSTAPFASGWFGFNAFNNSSANNTGRSTTNARAYFGLWPSPTVTIADGSTNGTLRCGGHPSGPMWWRFDPSRKQASPMLRGKALSAWDTTANIRAHWYACTNSATAADAYPYLQGIATYSSTVNDSGTTTISGLVQPVPELASSTYAVYGYTTPWTAANGYPMFQFRMTASTSGGVEMGALRWESSNTKGIWIQHCSQGSARVNSLMAGAPDCGPWLQAFGPYRVGIIACNVNDAFVSTPAQWEVLLRQAITDLRTLCNQPTLPVIVWIQVSPIFGATESTYAGYFDQYPGVAKTVAESMPGVVAINTARVIRERYATSTINWVPGGNYTSIYNAGTAYAVGDVMQYPGSDPTLDPWYRCKTATTAGQTPVSHAAKWKILEAAYNAATTYEYGDCVSYAGQEWAYLATETPAAGQEPGVHANWVVCFPYPPRDRVHQTAAGAQAIVDEFVKSLRELAGYRRGYRSPGILPRRRLHPGRPSRSELYDTWRKSGGKAIASGPRRRREAGGVA